MRNLLIGSPRVGIYISVKGTHDVIGQFKRRKWWFIGCGQSFNASTNDNNTNPDTIPHCKTTEDSCKCNNQENCGEWVIEAEELLHVEINGIFQAS